MSLLEAIILGIVQGLTEFLPVSSSGHLAVIEKLFKLSGEKYIAFDVLVHLATALAIIVVLFRDILRIILNERRVVLLLIIGSIPAAFVGFLFRDYIGGIKGNLLVVGIAFIATAGILVLAHFSGKSKKDMHEMDSLDALVVGINQAFAIMPGLSRSGLTISAARLLGVRGRDAFTFAFLLGVIAILGAGALEARNISGDLFDECGFWVLAAAFVSSFASGAVALYLFRRIVIAGKLHYFAFYLIPVGVLTIILEFIV